MKTCKFDEDIVKISWEQNWEQQKSNTLTFPPKENNLGLPGVFNTNGFRTEVMKDYYITMESMFLVVKLYFHPSLGYANVAILLP